MYKYRIILEQGEKRAETTMHVPEPLQITDPILYYRLEAINELIEEKIHDTANT